MNANHMPYVDSNSMIFHPFSVDKSFDCHSLTSPYTASLGRQVWAARNNEVQGLGNLIPALPSPQASFRTADAFRVTCSEKVLGRSSRIRHRNVLKAVQRLDKFRPRVCTTSELSHLLEKEQRSTTDVLVNFCPSYTNLFIHSKKSYKIKCSKEHFHIF